MKALLALLVLIPGLAFAGDDGVPPPPRGGDAPPADAPGDDAPAEPVAREAAPLDAFTERLLGLVDRYYDGIGQPPDDDERGRALESIQAMLLDGVSLPRVTAAVEDAVRLHNPGRAVPFYIAVPLRVRPADAAPPLDRPPPDPPPAPVRAIDPEIEARRAAQRAEAAARRTRVRLYEQWEARTKVKRTLLSVGVPLWSIGYGVGFGMGGLTVLAGQVTHEQAWLRAIPLVGQFIYYGTLAADGALAPDAIAFGLMEVAGAGLIVASLAIKTDWPYERDPTALHLRRPDGRLALAASPVFSPIFGGVTGVF